MSRLRFTIAQSMGLVLFVGDGIAALRSAYALWSSVVFSLTGEVESSEEDPLMPAQNRETPILAGLAGPQAVLAPGALILGTLLLAGLALVVLGYDLQSDPHWLDETAYISQSYFFDRFLRGARDDPAWVSIPALDLPPLEKYLIGLMLRARGYPRPGPREAMAWYNDPSHRSETPEMLLAARWPSVILGTLGCLAVFGLGALGRDRRTGAIAALLLLVNPLYDLLARRAIADIPCEALVLTATAFALRFWQRTLSGRIGPWGWIGAVLGIGILAGLAVLAKLNGILALLAIGSWAVLALSLPRVPAGRKASIVGSAPVIDIVALATFVLLNPMLTARPTGPVPAGLGIIARAGLVPRLEAIVLYRLKLAELQRHDYSHYALKRLPDKIAVVAVQGFGRFGPFGPRLSHFPVRYDWVQDRWALIWGPWVILGAVWAARQGRRQLREGHPPTAWAILLQACLALMSVTIYIPLAWDRYHLPIVAGSSLLAAGLAVAVFDRLVRLLG